MFTLLCNFCRICNIKFSKLGKTCLCSYLFETDKSASVVEIIYLFIGY